MYTVLCNIVKGLLKAYFKVTVIGLEHVPAEGGLIVVSNHQGVVDSYALQAFIPRHLTFLTKKEYFEKRGVFGWFLRWILSFGSVAVDRKSATDGLRALKVLTEILRQGGGVGLHPEGTRAPDGRVYRGKQGVITMAWDSGASVLPVAFVGTREANPPGRRLPRFRAPITMIIGTPMNFEQPTILGHKIKAGAKFVREVQTHRLMEAIAGLAGVQYVDLDAAEVKATKLKAELAKDE